MTAPADAPARDRGMHGAWWVMWRLVRNQPVRYATSLTTWVVIWSMPILVGLLVEAFFEGLTGTSPWSTTDVAVGLLIWVVARVTAIVAGIRLHASLMVRARTAVMRRLLAGLLGLPAAGAAAEGAGEVVSRFRDDTEHLQEAFDFSVDFVGAIVAGLFAFALLFRVDPVVTVAVFMPVLLVVGLVRALGPRIRRYRVAARETTEEVTGFLGTTFGAAAAVKVAGAESGVLRRFDRLNERRRHQMVRDRTLESVVDALVNNTTEVTVGIVLVLAAGGIGGPGGLSVGEVALFTVLLSQITFAANMAGRFLARVRQAAVSLERMVDLVPGSTTTTLTAHVALDRPDEARTGVDLAPGPDDPPLLELVGVTSRHPDGEPGVRDVDLAVRRGQLVVVTGRVGSGKTTLLRAALGLVPLERGEVRWRGVALDDPSAVLVPPRTAYTPQVPRLFSMSLADNLRLGVDASEADVARALATTALDVDLADMPDGLGTTIGPRGLRLSGGQVQRAAAARMLVRDPRLLVVDDLSSALDVETEATLWARLFDERDDVTALVVSHRRPALARADLVVLVDDGRVVARGTADRLRATSARFRELWG